ncbi:methionine adenosyltransferase [Candidatus Woesearchaeota archaeon]|nr:methionine adenosyltransferase [Candidatus Woesearchaeota archaeon]
MLNISIEKIKSPVEKQKIELVERKGLGHPDYICDLCCEAVSRALSQEYTKRFGTVLHHNVDKGLLVAGKSIPKFGGGRVLEQIKLTVAGRATSRVGKQKIDVKRIAFKAVKKELNRFRYLKDKDIKIIIDIMEGAANLQEVFKKEIAVANDTSFGAGHYPLSRLESVVKKVAYLLNSKLFLNKFKAVGEDIKVLGLRKENKIRLTLAIAFVDKYVRSMDQYILIKQKVLDYVKRFAGKDIEIDINTLDDETKDEKSIYLTVTGLSAEHGDDGNTGRGNRMNGLITPNRPVSLEATAGKNINHPGKLYQVMAYEIAKRVGKLKGINECIVKLASQIGKPLDEPQIASIAVNGNNNRIKNIVESVFRDIKKIQKNIVKGRYEVF